MLAFLLLVAPVAPQQPDRNAEFQQQFDAAVAAKDTDGMDKTLQRYKEQAIDVFLLRADTRSAAPTDELNRWVDSFVASWDRVFHSTFARNYDHYLQLLDSKRRVARARLMSQVFAPLNTRHIEAVDKRDPAYWQPIQVEVEGVINGFADSGDLYFLAFAYNIKGNSWNKAFNDKGGDNQKALDAYNACLAARDKLGLTNDQFYTTVKNIRTDLMGQMGLVDPDAPPAAARKPTGPPEAILPAEGAEWAPCALQPGYDEKPEAMTQPSDLWDLDRLSWGQVVIQGPGSAADIPGMSPKVTLRRRGLNEFVLDGGGTQSKPFGLQPKPVVVEYERKHQDGSTSKHALMLACGTESDTFQGATLNLALRTEKDSTSIVYLRSVATRTGKTPFGDVTLFDLNGDGQFGYADLQQVGENGLIPGTFLYRYDSMMLGKSKRAVPYAPWIADSKGAWYELKLADNARAASLELRPAAPKLGSLKLSYKSASGLELASLAFVSQSTATKGLVVEAAGGKGGVVALPIGRYVFQQGLLRGKEGAEAVILPPDGDAIQVDINEGQTAELAMGGPFRLSVSGKISGRELLVDAKTLCVVGSAGERYERLVGAPLGNVDVQVKGGKSGKLEASGTDEMNRDWSRCFVPQDTSFSLKEGEKSVQLKLSVKKHPWFGNLESDWIEISAP